MQKLLLSILLLLWLGSSGVYAQYKTAVTDVTRINFLSPGISYEKSMRRFQSLYINGFIGLSFAYQYSSALGSDVSVYYTPGISAQYRFYYNARSRADKGKRTALNSLNYIAPAVETIFSRVRLLDSDIDEANPRAVNTLGMVWGFQRNYPKHFSLDLNLGYGVLIAKASRPDGSGLVHRRNAVQAAPLGQLTLGFWLSSRQGRSK